MSEPLSFRISSALKSVIGRDLITNDFVAVFELVKNSFDAAATKVDIVFQHKNGELKKIYIVDNGKGMSYEDLVDKWLFVAYSAKKDGSEDSNKKRIYAGNKGVGRFSCDRLGGKLKIQTRTNTKGPVDNLDVNWGDFEVDSKELFGDVDIKHSISNDLSPPPELLFVDKGVVLEISDIREPSSWDRKKILKLKSHLSKIINPFGNDQSVIDVHLYCANELNQDKKEQEKTPADENQYLDLVNGPINNFIFEILKGKTTSLKVDLNSAGDFHTTLVDRGELIYEIEEPASGYPELIGSNFSCHIFYLNLAAKQTFTKRMSVRPVAFGSIFLFRNGFRVFPIGEEGDDFWRIDRRRAQGHSRYLGTRDIMGRIDIAGDNDKFMEASSRDKGLVETPASKELFDCVWEKCLKRIEKYVVGITWKDKLDKSYETTQRLNLDENRSRIIDLVGKLGHSNDVKLINYSKNLVDVLDEKSNYFEGSIDKLEKLAADIDSVELRKNIDDAREKFSELKKAEEEAIRIAEEEAEARRKAESKAEKERKKREEAEERADKAESAYKKERQRSMFLMSSESRDKEMLESFLHQIIIYAADSKERINFILRNLSKDKSFLNSENSSTFLSELAESTEKIITTSRFATSANFTLDSSELKDDLCLFTEQYIEKICTAYHSRIQVYVKIESPPFISKFSPIELGMVFDNLVNNAKKFRASKIGFYVKSNSSGVLEIVVRDNGRGMDRKIKEHERIFEKGYTTTRGSGLGLYHTRQQIERMGGEIVLPSPPLEKGFELIIRLRKI